MRRLRVSIAVLMAAVLALAVNLATIRAVDDGLNSETIELCLIGSLPMIDALAIASLMMARGLWRGGGCRLSLAGFVAVGGVTTPLFLASIVLFPDAYEAALTGPLTLIDNAFAGMGVAPTGTTVMALVYAAVGVLLAPIQFVPALLGAWLGRGRRITVGGLEPTQAASADWPGPLLADQ